MIGVDGTRDSDVAFAALRVAKRPNIPVCRIFVGQAKMLGEIFSPAGLAVPGEIRRRGDAKQTRFADLAPHETRAANSPDAHRDVETFVDQVGCAVGELDVETQLRIAGEVVGDGRREMARAKRHRAGQTQRAARFDGSTCREMADTETSRRSAARAKLPVSTTLTKAVMA